MSTEEGIRLGLEAAAAHLEAEAVECEKKAERLRGVPGNDNRISALLEHVNLLRSQAGRVRGLRVTRGR